MIPPLAQSVQFGPVLSPQAAPCSSPRPWITITSRSSSTDGSSIASDARTSQKPLPRTIPETASRQMDKCRSRLHPTHPNGAPTKHKQDRIHRTAAPNPGVVAHQRMRLARRQNRFHPFPQTIRYSPTIVFRNQTHHAHLQQMSYLLLELSALLHPYRNGFLVTKSGP